jgi:lysophospholipase L1-like esterase
MDSPETRRHHAKCRIASGYMEQKPPRGRRGADWPLRIGLSCAFVVLVVVASVVASTGATKPQTATTTTSVPTGHGTTTTIPGETTTTTIPGAYTGKVTLAAVGHGCGFALASPKPSIPAKAKRAVGHCTVLEIGDSLGNDLGWGLSRHLATTSGLHLVQLDKSSSGLSNSWFYSWPVHLAAYLQQYRPQLVLVMLGGNDEQGMTVNGAAVQFGEPTWRSAYVAQVRRIVSEATSAGAYVLWVGMPIMQPTSYNQGMMILNASYQQGVTSGTNATFVPTWSLFSNPAGQFESPAAVNGVETTLREPDGIHFSFSGEDVIATYIIREMARIYHVALSPTSPAVITHWG